MKVNGKTFHYTSLKLAQAIKVAMLGGGDTFVTELFQPTKIIGPKLSAVKGIQYMDVRFEDGRKFRIKVVEITGLCEMEPRYKARKPKLKL